MDQGFASLGGGGSSSGSKAASSFLQLPLSTAAAAAPPGAYYGGPPLALHQAGPSQYGHHHKAGEAAPAEAEAIKAKIMSHPQYSALLAAYLDCQKVGAPPEVLDKLSAVAAKLDAHPARRGAHDAPRDPELDQFMEAYCNMLVKYREELTRPIQEAVEFLKRVEAQLDSIAAAAAGSGGSARFFLAGCQHES